MTPYIHVFVNHVKYFIEKYGCLGPFEMEAVEQLNYVNKLVFFKASNHGKGNCAFTITEQVIFITLHKFGYAINTIFQCNVKIIIIIVLVVKGKQSNIKKPIFFSFYLHPKLYCLFT